MSKFCRLFEFPDGEQVLIYIEDDNENEEEVTYNVVQVTDVTDTLRGQAKFGFADEEKRNEVFDNFNIDDASKFRAAILQFAEDNIQ